MNKTVNTFEQITDVGGPLLIRGGDSLSPMAKGAGLGNKHKYNNAIIRR